MNHKIIAPLISLAVPIDTLHLDPANARRGHAIDKIAASLEQYGQRKPIVVNKNEAMKVEAGNGTLQAAKQLGWTHIAAVTVEDDALTAVGYGIADNRLSELSEWDDETLATLLQSLDLDDVVTGFDDSDLQALIDGIGEGLYGSLAPADEANDPYEEWEGMPEFENEDKTSYQSIHVHFKDAAEVEKFGKMLGQSLTEKTRSIWFSQREKMLDARDRYTS